ncbi:NADH:flavin oxidoreductase/NADH oxidase family protein [Nocardioides zeae]|uniref:2,4-dienoyl-CoA reductase-like NADH-dependent reductase (Old Yellow Enzyme family) n=1 Tax=Nocardioides zeae TaxID=1457234 RepID=A0AAJ1U9C1_9ACTN|nr:NADH:flavin oxidoreductase/NADH oxidase family protein [Nocardioides zeae]MDQ1105927.1 2,4-dienoyl-CoA reductase-like NADH-dependent reductase (Old Yellow Enzyme family) [Nocardioides zeae]
MTDLGTPLDLPCGQRLPNRLMKSALSEALGTSAGAPTRRLERLYDAWAGGGWGLVVTGNVMVDLRHRGEPGNVVVEDERHLDALRRWAAGFRASGTPLWMQVNHPGRQANVLVGRTRPVAPSAVAADVAVATRPRALTEAEIRETIERYAATAAVAEAAGFDGVQVHGAHGYLVTQFLSPRSNQRTDAWGGDPERRRRFVLEVVRAIRERVSPGFAVGIKLNSADFQRGGFTESESREVVAALAAEGIDLLEVSGGTYESPVMFGPDTRRASTREREAYFLEYAASVRDAAGAVPVAVTGGFRTRAAMTAALGPDESDTGSGASSTAAGSAAASSAAAPGECDVIGLGRPASAYPHVARDLLDGRLERIELPAVQVGARRLVRRLAPLHTVDSALDLSWHTDQLHRLGAGKAPDLARPWWRTAVTATLRNGPGAFVPKRG